MRIENLEPVLSSDAGRGRSVHSSHELCPRASGTSARRCSRYRRWRARGLPGSDLGNRWQMERTSPLSSRAVSCFAHGLSHLFSELGTEEGLRTGARILHSLSQVDLDEVVARGEVATPATRRYPKQRWSGSSET